VTAPPARTRPATTADRAELDRLVSGRLITAIYQPLIDLRSGATVGFEALARGPAGSPLHTPDTLFDTARAAGRLAELDWVCRAAALRGALDAGLSPALTLFVNSEPACLGTSCPADLLPVISIAEQRLRLVLELTERAIAADPAALLATVEQARSAGWGIALDDVGADPASLAVMPFVAPDVIKLDLRLVQQRPTPQIARIVNAVLAQAERTGATILAEGIETARHAATATTMGATLGQGWFYGRPGPLPVTTGPGATITTGPAVPGLLSTGPLGTGAAPVPRPAGPAAGRATPFQIVARHRPTATASKELLLPMSMYLENKGLDAAEPTVLLACFQHARHFTPATRRRFAELARRAVFTAAIGAGMPARPLPGVFGGPLAADDPLCAEWIVVAIGPHFAAALVARDLGDSGPEPRRRFDFAITHDRALAVAAGQALLPAVLPGTALPSPRP
jgi:EAL domain-containing protein (putative c-di-GMP-specific phosphodiesterase class I)